MKRQELIEKLCALTSHVGTKRYKSKFAHDCFCSESENFQFDKIIFDFIEHAVQAEMRRGPVTFDSRCECPDQILSVNDICPFCQPRY